MISRRALFLLMGFFASSIPSTASAAEPFDEAGFAAAQAAGRPIIVEVTAPWCPICKTQRPILKALSEQTRFKNLAIYEIDFDTQKALMRRFGARMQSTLIVFKGGEEVGRSVGETQGEWIESLVEKAL
ncbi:thioredoxin family protein [Methylobacterium marchantiae]|uniref:Thioredoxin family protein n=1 Tax=Methylobacterium marchantiae TaxID=600331 RepID=A0ABW3WV24_9HYPH|nr:hypothetical protein AIGOOFII_0818 [Methylobacterium marchantiae]